MNSNDIYTLTIPREQEAILAEIGKATGNTSKPKVAQNCIKIANELFKENFEKFLEYLKR